MNSIKQRTEELLKNKGFELAEEQYSPKNFGSWYTEYSKGHNWVRLVWDGREGYINFEQKYLSNSRDNKSWEQKVGCSIKNENDWAKAEESIKNFIFSL